MLKRIFLVLVFLSINLNAQTSDQLKIINHQINKSVKMFSNKYQNCVEDKKERIIRPVNMGYNLSTDYLVFYKINYFDSSFKTSAFFVKLFRVWDNKLEATNSLKLPFVGNIANDIYSLQIKKNSIYVKCNLPSYDVDFKIHFEHRETAIWGESLTSLFGDLVSMPDLSYGDNLPKINKELISQNVNYKVSKVEFKNDKRELNEEILFMLISLNISNHSANEIVIDGSNFLLKTEDGDKYLLEHNTYIEFTGYPIKFPLKLQNQRKIKITLPFIVKSKYGFYSLELTNQKFLGRNPEILLY